MRKPSVVIFIILFGGLALFLNLSRGAEMGKSPLKTPNQIGSPVMTVPVASGQLGMELQTRGKGLVLKLTRPAKVAVYGKGKKVHSCGKTTECPIPLSAAGGVDELTFVCTYGSYKKKKTLSLKPFAHLFRASEKSPADPGQIRGRAPTVLTRKSSPPPAASPEKEYVKTPFIVMEEVFLRDDVLWVRLKNTGGVPLSAADRTRGRLVMSIGIKRHVLHLGSLGLGNLSPGESAELPTGIAWKKRVAVNASLSHLPADKGGLTVFLPGAVKQPSFGAAQEKDKQIRDRIGTLGRFHSQNPDKEFVMLDYGEENEVAPQSGELKKTGDSGLLKAGKAGSAPGLKPFETSMAQARRPVPLDIGPQAHVVPGSAHGLRVTIEGGGAVFHPGDELTVHVDIENPDDEGFYAMGSDWWDYHTVLYLHDRSHDIDQMGLWRVPRHSLTSLSDDRRRGSFRVTVPAGLPEIGAYVISIVKAEDAHGHSGLFSVWPSSVTGRDVIVENPNTRVQWARGSLQEIRWRFFERPTGTGESDFRFIPRDRFIVEVLHSGSVADTVPLDNLDCDTGTNRCSLGWIVPDTLAEDSGYRIRVRHSDVVSLGGPPPGDESDSDFQITAGARIRIDNPIGGRSVNMFGPLRITGYITGIEGGSYNIRLLQYGSLAKVLRERYSPISRMFEVPQLLTTSCDDRVFDSIMRAGSGEQYQVELEYAENPEVRGTSENFYIRRPTIDVQDPDGGETWRNGETHHIRWQFGRIDAHYLGVVLPTIDIMLERGGFMGTEVECIARNLPSSHSGSYSWTVGAECDSRGTSEGADLGSAPSATGVMGGVPERVPPGTTFRVRVQSSQCPRIQGLSEGDFSITD